MEIKNPVIPNAIAGQSNIGKNSRLPVKADRFAVNQNNSNLPSQTEENQRNLVTDENKQSSQNVVATFNEDNKSKSETDVNQQNPLLLARQKAGQLATTPQQQEQPGNELVIQNTEQEIVLQSAKSEIEQLPVSIKTYLDNSKLNAEDSDGKNIDYFI